MNVRIFLVSMLLIMTLFNNSFAQESKITRKNFGKTIQGVWILHFYKDTLNTMVLDYTSFVDTLTISKDGDVIEKRTLIANGEILIFKEHWEYMDKEKKICKTYISSIIDGKEFKSEAPKDCQNVVIKMHKNEMIIEWLGVSEEKPNERVKMQSRYKRVVFKKVGDRLNY